jgi:Bifunctional DNA primase/polymerase, N-terminal
MSTVPKTNPASNPTDLLGAALQCLGRDIATIPVNGKKAAIKWKRYQTVMPTERELRQWFSNPKVSGLAVIHSCNLVCRDFDKVESYEQWAAHHPNLANVLPTVETPRPGRHVYFRGKPGFVSLADGDGEYRGDCKHYTLFPPSVHPSGLPYRWLIPFDSDLPEVDPVRAGLLRDTQATQSTHCMCQQGNPPITSAITDTLPAASGQRNRRLFDLARRLKAVVPGADAAELKPIVREWFGLALPVIRSKEWSETWADFVVAWQAVKHPAGGKWAEIVQAAQSVKVDTGEWDGATAAIIRLAAALQAHHGPGKAWPLSCDLAGKEAGVSRQRAWSVLKMLRFEGVIELVTPAGSKGSKLAAEYRFLGVTK